MKKGRFQKAFRSFLRFVATRLLEGNAAHKHFWTQIAQQRGSSRARHVLHRHADRDGSQDCELATLLSSTLAYMR